MARRVIITMGDPAGCGPFITLKAIEALSKSRVDFFVVGDKKILAKYALYDKLSKIIDLVDLNTAGIDKIKKGYCSKLTGYAGLSYLNKGLEIIRKTKERCLVTAPLSKEAVKSVFPRFKGHTEYLADYFKVKNFSMMMVSEKLKVVLFSRHIPLREVSHFLNKVDYSHTLNLVYSSLKNIFKIKNPKIAAISLNPHAGINTFLAKEEEIIYSAIREFRGKVYGPFPSDTIFVKENLKKFDCLIAAYHDQAMIPFKIFSFKKGVNLTLGLPIIRTSPSHGVAYEVMRQQKLPFFSSMVEAIKLALKLA